MNKLQKDTTEYILYSPDSLKYITDNIYKPLDESITFYKKLFDIKEFRKVQINFFDNIEDFRNYIYELRKDGKVLPSYAKGTFDKGMINAFIETNWLVNSPMYNKKLYMASHELFHIMYKELIWEKENKQRIIWFDEGMAQLFSGEYSEVLNDENFSFWFNSLIKNTKTIPNLNDLSHGINFETEDYSGYKLSLLAVKYLYETLSFDDFKALMHNTKEILEYGKTVVNDAISYFKTNKVMGVNIDFILDILSTEKPSSHIRNNCEEVFKLIPELALSKDFNQNNKWHVYDVFEHILHVIDGVPNNYILRIAALFHDIGKPFVYKEDENKVRHFWGHWDKSNEIFLKYKDKFNIDEEDKTLISNLILYHDLSIEKLTEEELNELLNVFDKDGIIMLYELKQSDLLAQNKEFHYLLNEYEIQKEKVLSKFK